MVVVVDDSLPFSNGASPPFWQLLLLLEELGPIGNWCRQAKPCRGTAHALQTHPVAYIRDAHLGTRTLARICDPSERERERGLAPAVFCRVSLPPLK